MLLHKNNILSNEQLLKVVEVLEAADQKHRDWLARMHVSIICKQPFEADVFAENAHRCCMFGRWYYSDVPDLLKPREEFLALELLHTEMHDAARELAITCRDDQQVEVEDYELFVEKQRIFSSALLALRDTLRENLYSFDSLTGLMTRQPFALIMESEYARLERSGGNSCVVIIDIDRFKLINDGCGHLVGDRVLREVAQFVRSRIRPYDAVCRYGGEEFLIMLPNTSLHKAYEIIDRLREDIARLTIHCDDGKGLHVTISAGISRLSEVDEKTSVGNADKALYKAKNSGRNRVCVIDSDVIVCKI